MDLFDALVSRSAGGVLPPDADPRNSKHVGKRGKLKVLKMVDGAPTWQSLYFLMVGMQNSK